MMLLGQMNVAVVLAAIINLRIWENFEWSTWQCDVDSTRSTHFWTASASLQRESTATDVRRVRISLKLSSQFRIIFLVFLSFISWRQSHIVPIPKPDKDTTNQTNYRPIALTSCVCKVMERMINNRLVWYLERNKLITPTQSGFRKGRILYRPTSTFRNFY